MFLAILFIIFGLAVLIGGGELFVRGSASLAKKMRVSPIVIGLTVVAFGTSAAEMVVNIFSALQGAPDLAIGNILGSNIANILLVLGISAVIAPLAIKRGTAWKEIPFSILAVIMLFILSNDVLFANQDRNFLSRADGLVLIGFFLIFLYYTYGLAKATGEKEEISDYSWFKSILFVLVGVIALALGGKLVVDGGVSLGKLLGISELFIGITMVALGTSLPELATCAIAAYRNHDDLVIGNVVGSNIFNVFWVLGLTPIISPIKIGAGVNVDLIATLVASLMLFVFMLVKGKFGRYRLSRVGGLIFLLSYMAYIAFVFYRK